MTTLRYITAGESHGKALSGILEGIPSGLLLSSEDIDRDLQRRQGGYGRGGRMKIESDHAEIISGVRWGKTIGSPVTVLVENRDFKNWSEGMSSDPAFEGSIPPVTKPRPGHADLTGAIKYDHHDVRNILERSSARETAMRVALGAIAKKFLSEFNINIGSFVVRIGKVEMQDTVYRIQDAKNLLSFFEKAEHSPVRCPDAAASKKMVGIINKAIKEGNSLGGIFEVYVIGAPVGLGSHIQWDRKLDGRLARALMSIQAIKGVEIGLGFEMGKMSGVEVMDEIFYNRKTSGVKCEMIGKTPNGLRFTPDGFYRKTNNAGGIEGGMTNGMPIILKAAMKPIPTLRKPLRSVDIVTKGPIKAAYERSDICAVPAAAVVGEAMSALTIADAFLEKFGGDNMAEVKRNYGSYIEYVKKF
ncbi:MAG: chorismate synthase [Thermodesulfovibrionales bacterium]